MRTTFIISLFFVKLLCFGQNLVYNNSFETYVSCPTAQSGISNNLVPYWGVPLGSIMTPDYFNSCYSGSTQNCEYVGVPVNFGGSSLAKTGVAYAGIVAHRSPGVYNSREYIHQQLVSPLIEGQCYEIEFWVKLAGNARFSVDNLGAYISELAPIQSVNIYIDVTPTINSFNQLDDKNSWVKISGDYLAQGGEQYITIGNFYNDSLTNIKIHVSGGSCGLANEGAYYYIDDVVVQPCNGVYGFNQVICKGDSVTLYAFGSNNYNWVDASNPSIVLSTTDSLTVSPTENTNYFVYGDFDTTSIVVTVNEFPVVQLIEDTIICPQTSFLLTPILENAQEFWWHDNSTDSTYLVDQEGFYTLTASNVNCGIVKDSVFVVIDSLSLQHINDTTICNNETLLVSSFHPNTEYLWSTGETDSQIEIFNSGEYWVQKSNICGTYIDTFNIETINCALIILEIPNVFTPNSDGSNETFKPIKIENVELQEIIILNRWGGLVFHSDETNFEWNGKFLNKDCSEGVYFWKVTYTELNGKTLTKHGFFHLVR